MRDFERLARDFAMQLLAASILLWPVQRWLWDFPAAPVGVAVGGLIGFGMLGGGTTLAVVTPGYRTCAALSGQSAP